jgi:molecular chaperone Hsp33
VHGGACAQCASLVGREELQPLIAEQGRVESRCEFCGKRYEVSATQLADLFDHVDASHPPGSGTVH